MTNIDPDTSGEFSAVELFAAQTAHDLNNFLTGILGNLELLQNRAHRNGVADFDDYLAGARRAGSRATRFTQRLMAFSGRDAQAAAPVKLNAIIPGVIETQRAAGLTVDMEMAADKEIFCAAAQLKLALRELLDNAAEAAGINGLITLRTESAGDHAVISVTDDGPGMAPDILRRATEPFFSTRANGTGQGLGLAIVEHFARRSGGRLELLSGQGQGTTARLHLPFVSLGRAGFSATGPA